MQAAAGFRILFDSGYRGCCGFMAGTGEMPVPAFFLSRTPNPTRMKSYSRCFAAAAACAAVLMIFWISRKPVEPVPASGPMRIKSTNASRGTGISAQRETRRPALQNNTAMNPGGREMHPKVRDSREVAELQDTPAQSLSAFVTADAAPTVPDRDDRALGVRLGPDVKLPAASFAKLEPSIHPQMPVSPTVLAANQEIENDFYRELAGRAARTPAQADSPAAEGAKPEPAPDDGSEQNPTVVIGPGQQVEAALDRANEIYRSLFGNDAYNRRTIESSIEVSLPESSPDEAR